jgi:MSHA biogenesis protein MshP
MSHKPESRVSTPESRAQTRQGGWLMPAAAFIIVVMGLLAAGMARVGSQASIAGVQEQVSIQTFYAAESGAEYAINRLFYDTAAAITRSSASNACGAVNGSTLNLNAPGMLGCQASIVCQESVDASNTTSFFSIYSAASCGTGSITAARTVQVSASMK